MTDILPADFTSDQARQRIAGQIGALRRKLAEQQSAIEARDRIITTLKGDRAGLEQRVEELLARQEDLADAGDSPKVNRLVAELTRTRTVIAYLSASLGELLTEFSAPATAPAPDPLRADLPSAPSPPAEPAMFPPGVADPPATEKPKDQCLVSFCEKSGHNGCKLCASHQQRKAKYGDPQLINRKVAGRGYQLHREVGPGQYELVQEGAE